MAQNGQAGSDQFVMDIPALEPKRKQLRVAGHVVEMRDPQEVSLRESSRLIHSLQGINLDITSVLQLEPDDLDFVFQKLDEVIALGFVTNGERGIPSEIMDKVREVDLLSIAMVFLTDFFGRPKVTEILETEAEDSLVAELALIDESTGEEKSPGSDTGTEAP